jgi:ribosome-binding protein aMBF1 (putative translation factor)
VDCQVCGEPICPHGFCVCNEASDVPTCPDCRKRREDELDAAREAAWQRDVIGPLFGFDREES